MSCNKYNYRLLLVSSSASFTSALVHLLPKEHYTTVHTCSGIKAAGQALKEKTYDMVIIHAPRPDENIIRFSMEAAVSRHAAVLLIVNKEMQDDIQKKVAAYGVFTLPSPMPKQTLVQALLWLESAREHVRQFEASLSSLEEKMAEIRLVNRAKWILINGLHMSEADAHHYIEKQAMDCCLQKKIIAETIIKSYD